MDHTREKFRKHRGLMMIVAVLALVFLIEPGLNYARQVCADLIGQWYFGGPPR